MGQLASVKFKPEDFVQLAIKTKSDEGLRAELHKDPLAYLDALGVSVDDCFREVVQEQLKVVSKGSSAGNVAQPPEGSFVFEPQTWGLVLVINEEGMRWLKDSSVEMIGEAIAAALQVLAASSSDPLIAALVLIAAFWCTTQAVWILAEYGMMAGMDEAHHKGICLTWTWLGLALTCYVPFPTPVT